MLMLARRDAFRRIGFKRPDIAVKGHALGSDEACVCEPPRSWEIPVEYVDERLQKFGMVDGAGGEVGLLSVVIEFERIVPTREMVKARG